MRRFTWILLSQNAQVIGVDATSLTVGFKTAGARDSFIGGGSEEILRQAAIDMIGADWKIETAVDPSAQPGSETAPRVKQSATRSEPPPSDAASERAPGLGERRRPVRARAGQARVDRGRAVQHRAHPQRRRAGARSPAAPTPTPMPTATTPPPTTTASTAPSCSQRELGATVIEEIPHD